MKYYYGNSMKEAMANPPVEIKGTKELERYKECYSVVVPERGTGSREKSYLILREEDYSTEHWYDICDIVRVPHGCTAISITFDPETDIETDVE